MSESIGAEPYDPSAYPPFAVTVDIVVFAVRDDRLQLVLIQRNEPPFVSAWALPGGFVHENEDLEAAARREFVEETGVDTGPAHLAQLHTYGAPDRDPRMRVVTVAWWAVMAEVPDPEAGTDASYADLINVDDVVEGRIELAFDHRQIVIDALGALGDDLENSTVATSFWKDGFRISDLRQIYELVWGFELEPGNFQRKVRSIDGFVEPTGSRSLNPDGGRPAQLFMSAPTVRPLSSSLRRERDRKKKP